MEKSSNRPLCDKISITSSVYEAKSWVTLCTTNLHIESGHPNLTSEIFFELGNDGTAYIFLIVYFYCLFI